MLWKRNTVYLRTTDILLVQSCNIRLATAPPPPPFEKKTEEEKNGEGRFYLWGGGC